MQYPKPLHILLTVSHALFNTTKGSLTRIHEYLHLTRMCHVTNHGTDTAATVSY